MSNQSSIATSSFKTPKVGALLIVLLSLISWSMWIFPPAPSLAQEPIEWSEPIQFQKRCYVSILDCCKAFYIFPSVTIFTTNYLQHWTTIHHNQTSKGLIWAKWKHFQMPLVTVPLSHFIVAFSSDSIPS